MSVTADTLRKLASLSLSSEQMAGVLDLLAEFLEVDEKRKAYQRERKARSRDAAVTVTGQERDGHSDSDVKEIPPTPPKENNNNKNINTRAREADQIRANLESVLSPETAQDLIDHRTKLKKPLTASAAKRLAGKLTLCRDGPEAAANAMISNGWQGFEPEWMSRNDKRNSGNSGNGSPPGVVAFLRELHDQPGDDLHGGAEPVPNQRRQISG